MGEAGFEVRGLRKIYGSRAVLDDLTLCVGQGESLGLLGANGAGKTTLLKILLGLLPADAGIAQVDGSPARELPTSLRERIGYVPQQPSQFDWLNGKQMLAYFASFYSSFDLEYTGALLERWKVSLNTPIATLSPGHQQRLSIVRALAPRPDFIVMDEPMASLDPATRLAVIDELRSEQQKRPLTMIFSSHLTGDLRRFCTHIAVLAGGKMAMIEMTSVLEERAQAASLDFEVMLSEWMK
jgi:ABC-2 type transport system ATP-binding protein